MHDPTTTPNPHRPAQRTNRRARSLARSTKFRAGASGMARTWATGSRTHVCARGGGCSASEQRHVWEPTAAFPAGGQRNAIHAATATSPATANATLGEGAITQRYISRLTTTWPPSASGPTRAGVRARCMHACCLSACTNVPCC